MRTQNQLQTKLETPSQGWAGIFGHPSKISQGNPPSKCKKLHAFVAGFNFYEVLRYSLTYLDNHLVSLCLLLTENTD